MELPDQRQAALPKIILCPCFSVRFTNPFSSYTPFFSCQVYFNSFVSTNNLYKYNLYYTNHDYRTPPPPQEPC